MAKTSHGTDLQAMALADTTGDWGVGSTTTASLSTGSSGYIFAYANSNVIYTYIGTTLANVTGWLPGMLLTASGTMTGFPSSATIIANPVNGVYILSQYTTAALGNTAGTGAFSGSNYITASGSTVTDSTKAWASAAGSKVGSSTFGATGQWVGKTIIAGTAVTSTTALTTAPGSGTSGSPTTATLSSAASGMIGGTLVAGATFVITGVSGTTLSLLCTISGTPTTANTLTYGVHEGTVLANTGTVLVVDSWKSVLNNVSYTGQAPVSTNCPYILTNGASTSYYMALSQDTTNVTTYEQYLTSSYTASNTSVTVAAATTVNSSVASAPGNTVGTSYSVTYSSGTNWTAAILGGTVTSGGSTYIVTAAGAGTATLLCTVAGTATTSLVINYYTCTGSGTTFPSTCAGGILIAGTGMWLITYYSSGTALTVVPISGSSTASVATTYNISYNAVSGTNYAEQTTNGLNRVSCTYGHTQGSLGSNTTYTLTKVFTYTGASATAVNKVGIFNASQGGVMMFTTALPAVATLAQSGDTLTVTETVTLSQQGLAAMTAWTAAIGTANSTVTNVTTSTTTTRNYQTVIGAESSLVSYYKLDETSGTSIVDSKNSAYNGTIGSASLNQPSLISGLGSSIKFSGSSAQQITIPAGSNAMNGLGASGGFSVELWYRRDLFDAVPQTQAIFDCLGTNTGFKLYVQYYAPTSASRTWGLVAQFGTTGGYFFLPYSEEEEFLMQVSFKRTMWLSLMMDPTLTHM